MNVVIRKWCYLYCVVFFFLAFLVLSPCFSPPLTSNTAITTTPLPSCAQGPLLARALTEIDRGIEAATARREHHIYTAKALAALWVALLAGAAFASSDGPMG